MSITLQQLDAWAQARFEVSIEWNQHRSSFVSIADMEDCLRGMDDEGDFVSDEARAACIESDRCVALQVYPTTSVGFYRFAGRTLAEVVAAAWAVPELRPDPAGEAE